MDFFFEAAEFPRNLIDLESLFDNKSFFIQPCHPAVWAMDQSQFSSRKQLISVEQKQRHFNLQYLG